ncbi:MAG: hypothetical protein MPJ24_01940 [Pirellulaceae bacterium]|nr:hypothetical protein [Pirellulaceae bacterium]
MFQGGQQTIKRLFGQWAKVRSFWLGGALARVGISPFRKLQNVVSCRVAMWRPGIATVVFIVGILGGLLAPSVVLGQSIFNASGSHAYQKKVDRRLVGPLKLDPVLVGSSATAEGQNGQNLARQNPGDPAKLPLVKTEDETTPRLAFSQKHSWQKIQPAPPFANLRTGADPLSTTDDRSTILLPPLVEGYENDTSPLSELKTSVAAAPKRLSNGGSVLWPASTSSREGLGTTNYGTANMVGHPLLSNLPSESRYPLSGRQGAPFLQEEPPFVQEGWDEGRVESALQNEPLFRHGGSYGASHFFEDLTGYRVKVNFPKIRSLWDRWHPRFERTNPDDPLRHVGKGEPLEGTSWLHRPWHGGVFVGSLAGSRLTVQVREGSTMIGGLRLGKELDHFWGAELRLASADFDINDHQSPAIRRKSRNWMVDMNLNYYPWGDSKWRPYAGFGVGVAGIHFVDETGKKIDAHGIHTPITLGLKVRQTKNLIWRAGLTDNLFWGTGGIRALDRFSFSGGLDFHYGFKHQSYYPYHSSSHLW